MHPLILTGTLCSDTLENRVALVTGAGRGIGLETARSLAALGARVVIAEIDEATGLEAAHLIREESGAESALFVRTDVGDEASLAATVERATEHLGPIDIVVNNATVTPMGPVAEVPETDWDRSYAVNLRGPVTLARLTVPGMRERGYGVFVCLSSVGGAYMTPYEAIKAAQVELATSLADELEGSGVFAFAIGPGQVATPGLASGVRALAPLYEMTEEQFLALNAANTLTAEEAGAGIAAATAMAERFHGSESASVAGLNAAGIGPEEGPLPARETPRGDLTEAGQLLRDVRTTLAEQMDSWASRGAFARKWMERDFRRETGISAEDALQTLDDLAEEIHSGEVGPGFTPVLPKLRDYYDHYAELARNNTRDADELAATLAIIDAWQHQVDVLTAALGG